MPSRLHQAFVSVLRRRDCALELARLVGVPDHAAERWHDVDAEFPDPAGNDALYHADLAMVAFPEGSRSGKGLAGLLFEPQLNIDPGKGVSWPIYWVALRTRHACRVWQIVVSPVDAVVQWAANRLFLGEPQIPHVIGPSHVQPVLDLDQARANPAWAALAAALHARGPHARASAEILIQACASLPAEDRRCYLRLLYAGLEKDLMNAIGPSIPQALQWEITEYEREGGWFQHGLAEGLAEGEAKGLAEGEAKGREEGREEGHLDGKRQALLLVVAGRFALTDEQRARIGGCTDEAQLDRWLARLLRVDSVEALLAD